MSAMTEMGKAMERQPEDLRRILADPSPAEAVAERLAGRRVYLVGTGTSWHAANHGAHFLRLAGADAVAVSAADSALWGPSPTPEDALILLSHRGTKRYTSQVLERARAQGTPTIAISGQGSPGVDLETVVQETSGTFTASHLGALARLAQLAVALGGDLGDLEAVPAAVATALEDALDRSRRAGARSRVRRCRPEPVDGRRGRAQGARGRTCVQRRTRVRAAAPRSSLGARRTRRARLARRRRPRQYPPR